MKKIIKQILAKLSIRVTLISKKNELHQLGLNSGNSAIVENGTKVYLKEHDLLVSYQHHQYILKGAGIMHQLKESFNAEFSLDGKDVFSVKIDQLIFIVQTFEELFILNEIFINGIYNILLNKKFAFIDIGMNVGFTSLYFANKPNCQSVYAFEPFKLTYEQATVNLKLNPAISAKIKAYNYGLGGDNRNLTVTYDKEIKGNMGIHGVPDYLGIQNQHVINEEINLKNAAEILLPLSRKLVAENNLILLKVDCEGSEYDIFESFKGTGLLQLVSIIMMEWHFKGPDQLCSVLQDAGFSVFSFTPKDKISGMLYAFK